MTRSIEVKVYRHKSTGLLMAATADLPGFVVHAHSDDEMEAKLIPAYKAFIEAIGEAQGNIPPTPPPRPKRS